MKKSMKSALTSSLKAEDEAIKSRFEKAESLFSDRSPEPPVTAIAPEITNVEPPKKTKVIRDSFTLPEPDYKLIDEIKQRCLGQAVNVNKSEIIRAGLHALMDLSDEYLIQVIQSLEKVKTGRPSEKE